MAAIDLAQFQATFFAESREGLDAMEAGLLALESGAANAETINTVFRAAHSMKGGAATFGFTAITDTTHLAETLLDQLRAGRRAADAAFVDALLATVDALRAMLDAAERGLDAPAGIVRATCSRLDGLLGAASAPAASAAAAPPTGGWRIHFRPRPGLYASGNDPSRLLRELDALGRARVTCDLADLPPLSALDPVEARLAWRIDLEGDIPRDAVDGVFAWVDTECDLDIAPLPAIATPAAAPPADAPETRAAGSGAIEPGEHAETSMRVAVPKIDALINLVGELVINQASLKQRASLLDAAAAESLGACLDEIERNTRDLQEAVMAVRMVPVEALFSRFPRLVRDLAARLSKKVQLQTSGEGTELDKGVIERIVDPLVHLVRNALDHGLEPPEDRLRAGKPAAGTISLSASHQGGSIVIEVTDDGRGIDRARLVAKAAERGIAVDPGASDAEIWQLVFHPGLSTAGAITDISGRGVGMDVVRRNILALGGEVAIASEPGAGTRVTVRLPLTLAILDGMSVAVDGETYVLPLGYVVESLQVRPADVNLVAARHRVLRVRGEYLPLLAMRELFGSPGAAGAQRQPVAVVVESDGRKLALEIDELVGQQQVVVKSIESNYRRVDGVSGATILGDGRVALIVDVGGLARRYARVA
ncbi:chemotaxis protein CheA [Tahibacter soli]|uniref:Chemotaxis protein CheA n=1 Tax=Tahibacter soli TaxID=2983605 RepID=A0A9X3YLG5_9GAMM|nr:chemotaxis protein CheA [Tahibacter soli]MDC8012888.1 chemotaxis protein CheA [Tahibacter soli]